jgi:hypothetical protein
LKFVFEYLNLCWLAGWLEAELFWLLSISRYTVNLSPAEQSEGNFDLRLMIFAGMLMLHRWPNAVQIPAPDRRTPGAGQLPATATYMLLHGSLEFSAAVDYRDPPNPGSHLSLFLRLYSLITKRAQTI